jgi:predicted nuclease with TOPRIM domain
MENPQQNQETPPGRSIYHRIKSKWDTVKNKTVETSKTLASKGAEATSTVRERFSSIDAENCTLKEAMAKIEAEIFENTKLLQDLEGRYTGVARKPRDQLAHSAAKMIYDRWNDEAEKKALRPLLEMDYEDV